MAVSTRQGSRAAALARLAARLGRTLTVAEMAELVRRDAAHSLGATSGAVLVCAGEGLVRVAGGARPQGAWAMDALSVPPPAVAEALETGRPVVTSGATTPAPRPGTAVSGSLVAEAPDADAAVPEEGPWSVALPLASSDGGCPSGAVLFTFPPGAALLSDDDMEILGVVAEECAQVLAHGSDRSARAQGGRTGFLADATKLLSSSLDINETLSRAANLAVPDIADWCAVERMERGELQMVTIAHVDPRRVETLRRWQAARGHLPRPLSGSRDAVRAGETLFADDVAALMRSSPHSGPTDVDLVRTLEISDAIWVPLRVQDRTLGVLTLMMAESGRRFTADDIAFADELGQRVALAINNAELYSETRQVAASLQASLLPKALPKIPGWSLTALYEQFGRSDVGGDFYDVASLSGRRLFAVVGDVMGHGADAAVAGARMRSAVRVLMTQDSRPSLVAAAMDRLMTIDAPTLMASAVFVLYDPATGGIDLTSAGHPPPLLVRADGTTRFLTEATSPVLGIQPLPRPCKRIGFAVGDAVLLYTDGLVERRDEDFETGLARLRSAMETHVAPAVAGHADGPSMDERLRAVVHATAGRAHDDVTALLLHRSGWG